MLIHKSYHDFILRVRTWRNVKTGDLEDRIILPVTCAENVRKASLEPWIEICTNIAVKQPQQSLLCTSFVVYIWNIPCGIFYRAEFECIKDNFPHSDPSSRVTSEEMTVKRRAQPSGRRWVSYLFIIFITVMPRDTMILELCYAKVAEKHKARAGVSPENL